MLETKLVVAPAKEILLFVHGYNNSFYEAVRRAAALATDISFPGVVVLWTWPSGGGPLRYGYDEDSAIWTRSHFRDFMSALQALEGLDRAHLLAHSMGARVVIDALEPLPDPAGAGQWPRFAYLVFAAPDVSTDVFKQQNGRARRFADRETLYASDGDWAIRTSSRIHKAPRAGQGGASDIIVLKDLDSVDASGVDAWASIGHAYVFSVPRGVADLRALLVDDAMPEKRGLIREEKDLLPYWRLAP